MKSSNINLMPIHCENCNWSGFWLEVWEDSGELICPSCQEKDQFVQKPLFINKEEANIKKTKYKVNDYDGILKSSYYCEHCDEWITY